MLAPINVSPWAIASGYLGLLTPLCGVTGPFALLTGILALRQIKKIRKWAVTSALGLALCSASSDR
jgi:hypothetical protein